MATKVVMPTLGLTMTEGTIDEWKVNEGDVVKAGDIIFSVSTDKLTNDIEAESDGVLLKILLPAGETAPCKSTIAWIGESGEDIPADDETSVETVEAPKSKAATEATVISAKSTVDGWRLATPYARNLAKEKNIELEEVSGSGPNGWIVGRDVENFVSSAKLSPLAAKVADDLDIDITNIDSKGRIMTKDVLFAAGIGTDSVETVNVEEPSLEAATANNLEVKKVTPLRKSIAKNMKLSWETSPRVTYTRPVDASAMKEMRDKLKLYLKDKDIKITYNHILMKVCAQVLMEFPDVNSSFDIEKMMLTPHKHANVGLAVAKGDGLIVPNVKACEVKNLSKIAVETEDLIAKTREGKVEMSDITGATFTISSLGAYGITSFSPIINQPELAILGVCDIVDTPVVRDGEIVVRPMMNLSLTADHRVIDGVMASKFLKRVAEILENPYLMMV